MKKAVYFICILSAMFFIGCNREKSKQNEDISTAILEGNTNNLFAKDVEDSAAFLLVDGVENSIIDVSDLNGAWIPDWNYRVGQGFQLREREFSWGIANSAIYTSFDIDITADSPFIHPPAIRPFSIINIIQTGNNSLILHADISDVQLSQEDSYFEIIIRFIDKNKIQIKADNLHLELHEGDLRINPYGGTEIWHRL